MVGWCGGHVPWVATTDAPTPEPPVGAPAPAVRGAAAGRRHLFGGHHQVQGNDDVGTPGPHGALAFAARQEVSQRIR